MVIPSLKLFVISLAMSCTLGGRCNLALNDQEHERSPVLLELFTSEGCSSCPPADDVLQKLDSSQPIDGAQLIVLSEHVDYWDHDGWKDPYSSSLLSDRQASYDRNLGLQEYTPQFIVDGVGEMRLSDLKQAETFLKDRAASPKLPIHLSSVEVVAGSRTVRAHVDIDGNSATHNADIYLAIAANSAESQVLHGENHGRELKHVSVVRQLRKIGSIKKGSLFSQDVDTTLVPDIGPGKLRVIVFVQERGLGKVIGAAMAITEG
jgi:hypothetical protein